MNRLFLKTKSMVMLGSLGVILLTGIVTSTAREVADDPVYSWSNLPRVVEPSFQPDTFNIRQFGAKPDGVTLNTLSINEAISTCSRDGGGVVLIPAGYWLTGPIELKSNVNLHLEKNAFLQFTADFDQYQIVEGNYEGKPSARNQSPISGTGLTNVAITGSGVIDGNGDAWRMVTKGALTEREWRAKVASGGLVSADGKTWYPSEKVKKAHEGKRSVLLADANSLADFEDIKDYLRPNMVVLTNCSNVLLEGVTFQNSPAWNLHPLLCNNLTLRNLRVKNPDYAQNGDGVDIESCANVLVESCVFDVGDDAICIKSGKDEEGRKRGVATQRVIIRNNVVYAGHGGFVVGSEMSGGVRDIFVEQCTFMGTDKGIRFKTTRGRGGVVENIFIRDINMANIVQEAIFFDMYYWTTPPAANEVQEIPPVTEETPIIRNVSIDRVVCNGAAKGIFIRGLPEMPLQNIRMTELTLNVDKGVEMTDADQVSITKSIIRPQQKDVLIYGENIRRVTVDSLTFPAGVEALVELNGPRSADVRLVDTDVSGAVQTVRFEHGADATMFHN